MPASHRKPIQRTLLLALIALLLASAFSWSYLITPKAPAMPVPGMALPAVVAGSAPRTSGAAVPANQPAAVEGWVTDAASGDAVRGAAVRLGNLAAETGSDGRFSFSKEQLASFVAQGASSATLQVSVAAPGYAAWSISGARYLVGDTLRLYARLAAADKPAVSLTATGPAHQPVGAQTVQAQADTLSIQPQGKANMFAMYAQLTPPATIRVYRTSTSQVEVVPFRDYIKHVLPNEWIPTWHPEALKAGAMAVKTYAWYWVSLGGKQQSLGADVKDNVEDQVYDPNVSYASTDAAVDATFNYVLTINGALFQTQYCAGSYSPDGDGDCPWSNLYMTQWGSAYHADHGRPWGWILQYYYNGARITPNPPGGGYTGTPVPHRTPTPIATSAPPTGGDFSIGQGSDRPDLFQEAYDRNGGAAALGVPITPVKWWLTYVTEFNVHAQRFSGPDGRGNVWIVYDVLKAQSQGVHKAFVLSGDIGAAYSTHTPPGPEWVGAPTSDPYVSGPETGSVKSQGFTSGTLSAQGSSVVFTPWPQTFGSWKAEYFPGHDAVNVQKGPSYSLQGQPALVRDLQTPGFDWLNSPGGPQVLGVGKADWSAQYTRDLQTPGGSYDFAVTTGGGVRLWVDNVLAIDSWQARQGIENLAYNADLAAGSHRVRLQFFSLTGAAKLQFDYGPHTQQAPPPPPPAPVAPTPTAAPAAKSQRGQGSLRVQVQWLGRGSSPSDRWVMPLTLLLSLPGDPTIIGTYQSTTDRNGVAFFKDLPTGIFDVHVKGQHTLQSARASIGIQSGGPVDLDMKAQIEGDVDGDNCVTPNDLAVVQAMLGADKNTPGFDPSADLNGDGSVTMSDLSLLRSGFDRCGDISADSEFHIMSTNSGPSLSEQLAPWMNPSSMQHNLSLAAMPSSASVRPGDVFSLAVMARAGSQQVDGAAFVLNYDPQRFVPVDAQGNPATGAEPGLVLPAVMGNWIDRKGGAIGFSSGMVQGDAPAGRFTVATIHFKVLPAPAQTTSAFSFAPVPSAYVQLTNGGENLLSQALGTSVVVKP